MLSVQLLHGTLRGYRQHLGAVDALRPAVAVHVERHATAGSADTKAEGDVTPGVGRQAVGSDQWRQLIADLPRGAKQQQRGAAELVWVLRVETLDVLPARQAATVLILGPLYMLVQQSIPKHLSSCGCFS